MENGVVMGTKVMEPRVSQDSVVVAPVFVAVGAPVAEAVGAPVAVACAAGGGVVAIVRAALCFPDGQAGYLNS